MGNCCTYDLSSVAARMLCGGARAASTGGGFKVSRIIILIKSYLRDLSSFIHPRLVKNIYMDGRRIKEETVKGAVGYLVAYVMIIVLSFLVISLDGFDLETNFTAVMATVNNIGPGLAGVGPSKNFNAFSDLSKAVLSFDMLAGRLELYPILLLVTPGTWRKK